MKVELLHSTPIEVAIKAIRCCYDTLDKQSTPQKDNELIDRVFNQYHHESVGEHIYFNFFIDGISRGCLQELARHRIASFSVKSTRYTLKELRNESPFNIIDDRAGKYVVLTGNEYVDNSSVLSLEGLRKIVCNNTSLDIAKYCLPESYKTKLVLSMNARSLKNFFKLRSSKKAHFEISSLAKAMYESLPNHYKFLFNGIFIEG